MQNKCTSNSHSRVKWYYHLSSSIYRRWWLFINVSDVRGRSRATGCGPTIAFTICFGVTFNMGNAISANIHSLRLSFCLTTVSRFLSTPSPACDAMQTYQHCNAKRNVYNNILREISWEDSNGRKTKTTRRMWWQMVTPGGGCGVDTTPTRAIVTRSNHIYVVSRCAIISNMVSCIELNTWNMSLFCFLIKCDGVGWLELPVPVKKTMAVPVTQFWNSVFVYIPHHSLTII